MKKRRWVWVVGAMVVMIVVAAFVIALQPPGFARQFTRLAQKHGMTQVDDHDYMFTAPTISAHEFEELEQEVDDLMAHFGLIKEVGLHLGEGMSSTYRDPDDGYEMKVGLTHDGIGALLYMYDDLEQPPWQPITDWLRSLTAP